MLDLRVLGTTHLADAQGQSIQSVLAQPKRFSVLVYLALAEGFCRRDTLLSLFWPELDQEHARHALRQATHYLRRSLGAELIVGRGDEEIALAPERVRCDAVELHRAARAGRHAEAVELYSGELLPGFFLDGHSDFERWLDSARVLLRRTAAASAATLADQAHANGDWGTALAWRERQLEILPGDELALRRLLALLDQAGDRAGALQAYEEFAEMLRRRYGAEPSTETRAVVDAIRLRDAALSATPESASGGPATPDPKTAGAVPSGRVSPRSEGRRWVSPPRWAAVVGGLAIVGLGVVSALPVTREALASLTGRTGATDSRIGLAVLPIADIGPDASAEYLGDGLTDELISRLGQLPGLWVSSRTSSYSFRDASTDVREIGRRLGVQNVIEGSVREGEGRVRYVIRLVRVSDGRPLWSQIYDRPLSGVLDVQEEIGRAVVSALQARTAFELDPAAPQPEPATHDAAAYDDYLRGQYLLRTHTRERLQGAIGYFSSAIEKDPHYSLAHAGLAEAYIGMANYISPKQVLPKAKAAAQRALALDDGLAETHLALANVLLYYDWDWPGAELEFRRAMELEPGNPMVHYDYASFLEASRRYAEMLGEVRRGLALERAEAADTLAFTLRQHERLASAYLATGRYEEARQEAGRALELDPASWARRGLVRASVALGDRARAARELDEIRRQNGGRLPDDARLARASALIGRRADALSILHSLQSRARSEYVPQDQMGTVYLGLGDVDDALRSFSAAIDDHHWFVVHLNSDPIFDPLRSEPRFKQLLRRIHAPTA